MSSKSENENHSIVPEKYADKIDQAIFIAGYLGFGVDYLVNCVELEREDISIQFIEESGSVYKIWLHGYYEAQTELRKTIMQSALSSSTPNLEKMLKYFAEMKDELKNLEDE